MEGTTHDWLHEEAWEDIDPLWQGRILAILEDLASLEQLQSCQVHTNQGTPLTKTILQGGKSGGEEASPLPQSGKLFGAVEQTFLLLGEELPIYLVERRKDSLLYIGFAAGMILSALFESDCAEGAVAMRFEKRIRHLRSLERTRNRGALYV